MNTAKTWLKKAIVFLVVAAMAITLFPFVGLKTVTKAAAGETPAHGKNRTSNGDGTYKLELSVTGDADPDKPQAKANILFVYDTSYSMRQYRVGGSTSPYRADAAEKVIYDFINGLIPYQNQGSDIQVALVTFASTARVAQGWTNNLTNLRNQFSSTGAVNSRQFNYGTNQGTGVHAGNGMYTNWEAAMRQALNVLNGATGVTAADDDPTFVIFITDGAPTTDGDGGRYNTQYRTHYNAARTPAYNVQSNGKVEEYYGIYAYGDEADYLDDLVYYAHNNADNPNIGEGTDTTVPNYFNATDTAALNQAMSEIFNTVVNYLGVGDVVIDDGTTNNVATSAGVAIKLLEVDEDSYEYWLSMPVNAASGNTYTFQRPDAMTGNPITYTVTVNSGGTCTITGGSQPVTVEGTIEGSGNIRTFKYKWTKDNGFDKNPPEAKLDPNTGELKWDLKELGTLLAGVTYSVTFDVFPSQETYDMIADIKNADDPEAAYNALDTNIKQYLKPAEEGNYQDFSLETNTVATLDWNDTRPGGGVGHTEFDNPPAVPTVSSTMDVKKEWDPISEAVDIALTVTKDGENYEDIMLTSDNGYEANINISTGLMRVVYASDNRTITSVQILDTGHDYAFTEMDDSAYEWDLNSEIVRPMLIDSATDISTLVLIENPTEANRINTAMNGKIFLQEGSETYFKIGDSIYQLSHSDSTGKLTAYNIKRSHLFLYKDVVGDEMVDEDGEFTFNLTVNAAYPENYVDVQPGTEEGTYTYTNIDGIHVTIVHDSVSGMDMAKYIVPATEDDNESTVVLYGTVTDGKFAYKEAMWFSMWDYEASDSVKGLTPTGWTAEVLGGAPTGYYYAPTGTPLTVTITKNNNVRFGNVPKGTTYTFVETSMTAGYSYVKAEQTDTTGTVTDSSKTVTGTVTESNKSFSVTYTNQYNPVIITPQVTKAVTGSDAIEAFAFSIAAADEVTRQAIADGDIEMPASTSVSTDPDNLIKEDETETVTFGKITINKTGTYKFTVDETTTTTAGGWTYDTSTHDITVVVTAGTDGKLQARLTGDNPTFTNSYVAAPVDVNFPVKKILSVPAGMTGPTEWEYTINVAAVDGAPEATIMTGTVNKTNDTASFGPFTYTAPGTYTYKVTETGEIDGVTNDADATTGNKTVTVTVSDDGSGQLTAEVTSTTEKPLTFTNTYGSEPTTASFPVKKILSVPEGLTGPATWSYTINVAANDGAPVAETMTGTVSNTADTATFGPFTYNTPGEYTYTVTETGTVDGVTNDAAATSGKTVTVTVVDNGDGTLTATADSTTAEPLTFTNRYTVLPTTVEFPVEKELVVPSGLEGPEEWEYTINVTANNGAPSATPMSGTVDQDTPSITFGEFRFTAPGTYSYTVTEKGTVAGVTNDAAATTGKTVTVTVVDNGNGTLTATADSTETSPLKFTNSYDVEPTTASFPVVKELVVPEGMTGPTQWSYAIIVAANDGAPAAETMRGTVDQDNESVTFGPISYDAPGTYTYTVTESGTVAGVTNDAAATTGKTVTVSVVDNGDGTLTATPSSTTASPLKFTNTYDVGEVKATFPVKKILSVPEGLDGPEEWEYTIDVAAVDGAPEAATMSGTINQDTPGSTLSFGQFTYTAPGTYTYTVTETGTVAGVTNDAAATTGKTVTVTVTDSGDGTLTATASSTAAAPLTFTNTYEVEPTTAEFPVEKILSVPQGMTGPAKWSYTIDVAAQGSAPAAETMSGTVDQDNKTATFGPFTYNKAGTYTYKVTETGTVAGVTNDAAATTGKTVTVTVVDNGNGTLTATASSTTEKPLQFTNTYTVEPTTASFPVEKILEVPEGLDGPEEWEYTINVAANGSAPSAATMTGKVDQDTPSVTFGPFRYTAPGTYTYKVTETGTIAGVTNDAEATTGKTVTVNVVDNGDGTLTATASSTTEEPLQFTNTYNVGEIEKSFPVKKELVVPAGMTGPTQWSYTIDVAANGNAPVATTMTGTINQDTANKTITFGPFQFTAPGTYTYKVTETGTVAGVTNDAAATTGKTVTVTVEDDGQGGLTAEVSSTEASPLTFTNTYNVGPTAAKIPVKKNVTSASGLTPASIEGKFTFTLAPVEGAPMPAEGTAADGTYQIVSGASGATVEFPEISYTAPGTYKYTIKESVTGNPDATSVDGIDLETLAPKEISVVVTDKGDGTLEAVVNGKAVLEFNNPYRVTSIDITIPVEKILSVPEGLTAPDITNAFTFTIADDSSDDVQSPLPKTTSITNPSATGGNMNFGTKDDPITISVPGEYLYTITETGKVDGVTNDATGTKTVKVTVTDKGDGTLSYKLDSDKVSFTNTYNVEPITAKIPVEKILEVGEGLNAPDITEEFTFTLTAGTNTAAGGIATPMPEVTEYTNPDADGGDMSFGDITYTEPGTYTYTVTETGEVDGVSAVGGVTVQTVTVVVVDNSDGTMTATVNGGETVTFINEYKVGEATAVIPVTKILNVAEGLDPNSIANMFTFTLTAGTNTAAGDIATPMPKTTSFTNPSADGGTVTFGGTDDPITFTAPGTYTYTVTETGSAPGVINDATATKDVTVVVTDNGDGTMTAVTNEGKALEFTNTYDVEPTEVSFPVKKILSKPDDATGPVEWSYRIDVAANNGAPVAETMTGTVSNTADTATFGPFKYYAPGTFTYTVTETGEIKGVTNDPAATAGKTVTVSVVDNGDGTMTATADSKVDAPLTFTNSYSYENITATPAVHKTLSYEDGLTPPDITEKYTFKLEAVTEGAPMPAADTEVKNPAADGGTKSFGTITFTKPGTYEYKVTETGTVAGVTNDAEAATGKNFKIIVTDNSEGKLEATIDYGTDEGHVTFINTYKVEPTTISFPVEKVLEEDEESDLTPLDITGKFTFDLTAVTAGAPMPAVTSQKNPAADGGTVTFGDIEFKKPGTYVYKVTETGEVAFVDNDPDAVNGKTVTVTVTDNRDGTMTATTETTAENPVKFINTRQQVSATVKKVWDDFDDLYRKRPESLDVDLMANGEKERTVTLNAGNQWTVTVKDLPKYDAEGEEIAYTWVEGKMPAGYELTNTETEGRVTTLTNSRRYGDLVIRKDLTKYNDFISSHDDAVTDQVTFIFHITAKKGDKTVYEDYAGLTFNGEEMINSVEIRGMIPVGAVVTVEEEYSGAGYAVQGQSTKTVTITDPTDAEAEVAEADLTNAYDDRIPGGYGIVNHYTKDNGRWTGENIGDNRVPAPVVQ